MTLVSSVIIIIVFTFIIVEFILLYQKYISCPAHSSC